MSIYIKGVEMQKDKPLTLVIYPDGTVANVYEEQRGTAVPVPPHGRLGDMDAYEALLRGLGNREYRRKEGTLCDAIKFLHPHYTPTIISSDKEGG